MSGLNDSLMQNITLDRKNRLHFSQFLYAKICMNKQNECTRFVSVSFWTVLLHIRPTRLCHALTGHKRHGLSCRHFCPEVSDMFRNSLVFSIANLLHIICSSPLRPSTCDIELWLIPLQGGVGGPLKNTEAAQHVPQLEQNHTCHQWEGGF